MNVTGECCFNQSGRDEGCSLQELRKSDLCMHSRCIRNGSRGVIMGIAREEAA